MVVEWKGGGKANLAELANVADLLALQGAEVFGDSAVLEVDDASEGLVEERTNRGDGEVAGLGLLFWLDAGCIGFEGGRGKVAHTARVWIIALKPMSTLPLPMISVTSEGSLGSRRATLRPSSLK